MKFGGIEAGGTKFICAVCDENLTIEDRISISTTTPEETMKQVLGFFSKYKIESIGVGSFGPIDVNQNSKTYGYVTTTPKLAWANYDFVGFLKEHLALPIAWTTDVNAAAYGELKAGGAQGKKSCIYITVGTGIGGGAVVNGKILEGFGHPEMGHILIKKHPEDTFSGNCPYHEGCLEGLAAGPALEARAGQKGQTLPDNHPVWDIEAYYLAQAIMSYTLILSPEVIIFGGGVMKQQHLLERIRKFFSQQMAHYVQTPPLEQYIIPCQLQDNAGITGCLLLAKELIDI